MKTHFRALAPLALVLVLTACGGGASDNAEGNEAAEAGNAAEATPAADGTITLTDEQIKAAGIQLVRASVGGSAGAIELPATIEGDPQGIQAVTAAIGGRVVSLSRNLGQSVSRGQTLAIIESREAAQLSGDLEAARARAALAQTNLRREQRLFAQRVSPEQDLIAARTAATEASIAVRQAQQQLSAAGRSAGALNRVALPSPISGQVISRTATLGQTVAADAELYRVANLSRVAINVSLAPADAGSVRPGSTVVVTSGARTGTARVTFVSPILDESTRLVPIIASLDNSGGTWRVGENVTAAIQLPNRSGGTAISVPKLAVQTVEGKSVVFVRVPKGFRAVPVRLGATSGDRVTIASGLTGREQIAGTNSFTLKAELGKGEAGEEE